MAPNRKRHAVIAPHDRWILLGELFQARRQEAGYRHRPAFARDRLPPTPEGNANVRLVADVEMGYRDTFPPGTLRLLAGAYEVTYESVTAVLAGETDALVPAVAAGALPASPMPGTPREDDVRPYADVIWKALLRLAARGVTDPSGAQVRAEVSAGLKHGQAAFSYADAVDWDRHASWDYADRVWLIADLQRRDEIRRAGRDGRSGTAG